MMTTIALTGYSDKGKSTTLNIVYKCLKGFGYARLDEGQCFRELGAIHNHDFFDIIQRDGYKIGFATMGDYYAGLDDVKEGETVLELLDDLHKRGCDLAICACNIDTKHIWREIKGFKPIEIEKTELRKDERDEQIIANGKDAERIFLETLKHVVAK